MLWQRSIYMMLIYCSNKHKRKEEEIVAVVKYASFHSSLLYMDI